MLRRLINLLRYAELEMSNKNLSFLVLSFNYNPKGNPSRPHSFQSNSPQVMFAIKALDLPAVVSLYHHFASPKHLLNAGTPYLTLCDPKSRNFRLLISPKPLYPYTCASSNSPD